MFSQLGGGRGRGGGFTWLGGRGGSHRGGGGGGGGSHGWGEGGSHGGEWEGGGHMAWASLGLLVLCDRAQARAVCGLCLPPSPPTAPDSHTSFPACTHTRAQIPLHTRRVTHTYIHTAPMNPPAAPHTHTPAPPPAPDSHVSPSLLPSTLTLGLDRASSTSMNSTSTPATPAQQSSSSHTAARTWGRQAGGGIWGGGGRCSRVG